jgi:hypothetical protein
LIPIFGDGEKKVGLSPTQKEICRRTGIGEDEFLAQRNLDGAILNFRGNGIVAHSTDMSGAPFRDGPSPTTPGPGPGATLRSKSSPFPDATTATDFNKLSLYERNERAKKRMTSDELKVAKATGVEPCDFVAVRDGETVGVDGLLR